MMLHWFQQAGHKPISLMGGGTALIPDPTLKDKTRPLLTPEEINKNIDGIKGVFGKFLKYGSGPTDAIMVNNYDWLSKLDYIGFLRDIGLHFTINRMLTFESVKMRLDRELPMTFIEFNYMILQGYDFLELFSAATARFFRWAVRTSGAISSTASNWAAARRTRSCSRSLLRCSRPPPAARWARRRAARSG